MSRPFRQWTQCGASPSRQEVSDEPLPLSRPPLDQGPGTKQPCAAEPTKTPGGEGIGAKVDAMRKRLQEHSALEDLDPLFASEAGGQEPLQKPPSRSQ